MLPLTPHPSLQQSMDEEAAMTMFTQMYRLLVSHERRQVSIVSVSDLHFNLVTFTVQTIYCNVDEHVFPPLHLHWTYTTVYDNGACLCLLAPLCVRVSVCLCMLAERRVCPLLGWGSLSDSKGDPESSRHKTWS